jgi:DNA polymerase-4
MPAEATILHADADAFFASVEQRDDPSLRGRPLIVGGGVVLAASYEAKAYGVRTAMGGRQALRLCPHALVVAPRMAAYAEASRALHALFEDTTPSLEGSRSTKPSLTSAAWSGSPAHPGRSQFASAATPASVWACP